MRPVEFKVLCYDRELSKMLGEDECRQYVNGVATIDLDQVVSVNSNPDGTVGLDLHGGHSFNLIDVKYRDVVDRWALPKGVTLI